MKSQRTQTATILSLALVAVVGIFSILALTTPEIRFTGEQIISGEQPDTALLGKGSAAIEKTQLNPEEVVCQKDGDCDDHNPYTQDRCLSPGFESCEHQHPFLRFDYYNYCWDYACEEAPPYPLRVDATIPFAEPEPGIKATGRKRVLLVFLYAHERLSREKFTKLTDKSGPHSLYKSVNWINQQARKYDRTLNVQMAVNRKQLRVPQELIVRTYEDSFTLDHIGFVKERIPGAEKYDAIVIVYYDSQDFSFSPHSTAGGVKLFIKQYAPNAYYPEIEGEGTVLQTTLAHELMHQFGASDKYTCTDPSSPECTYARQNGIGCLIETENASERGRDIMCHRVAVQTETGWTFDQIILSNLLITEPTAKELGWYDADGDSFDEVNDPCPFISDNVCRVMR